MLITLGCDDRYALPLAVTLHSLARRLTPDIDLDVTVLDAGLSHEHRSRVESVVHGANPRVNLHWVPTDVTPYKGLHNIGWGSTATYLPLMMPQLLESHDRAIYLDCDILIRADLSGLWKLLSQTQGGTSLCAVRDYGFPTVGRAFKPGLVEMLGIPSDLPYFNSGVMAINLEAWRENRVTERALEFALKYAPFMRFGGDQDALNGVIRGRWQELDPRWNVLTGAIDKMPHQGAPTNNADWRDAKILHYSGSLKPWKPGYDGPGKAEYLDEVRVSGWFENRRGYARWRSQIAGWHYPVRGWKRLRSLAWRVKQNPPKL